MSKHTPGPWSINPVEGPEYGGPDVVQSWIRGKPLVQHLDGVVVASIISDCIPEAHANANLIAAAPDLLEALETIKRRMYEPRKFMLDEVEAIIDQAIARAKREAS